MERTNYYLYKVSVKNGLDLIGIFSSLEAAEHARLAYCTCSHSCKDRSEIEYWLKKTYIYDGPYEESEKKEE